MAYSILYRRWPHAKRVWWPLLVVELLLLVPVLVLFGIQQPDLFRTKFWRIGYNYGFNSNPNIIIFAIVNGQPPPEVPFVWSQTLTNYNVAISVVNLFILLVKMITVIMKTWYPVISLVFSICQAILWIVSVYGQIGPDYADPDRPSPVAWYIAKSCDYAEPYGMESDCQLARGTLAVTVLLMVVMLANVGVSIWAMLPSETAGKPQDLGDDYDYDNGPSETKNINVEMHNMRALPTPSHVPFTPRTQAFNTLNQRTQFV